MSVCVCVCVSVCACVRVCLCVCVFAIIIVDEYGLAQMIIGQPDDERGSWTNSYTLHDI